MSELVPTIETRAIDYVPSFAVSLEEAAKRLALFQEFVKSQMKEGEDYGTIPGTEKPTLLKPGAEKLCNIFGFAPRFHEVRTIENWEEPGLFYFCYRCELENKATGAIEAQCIASANSMEDKYRWRYEDRECPKCGAKAIIKGKQEYGGGWVCWKKNGGCGAKFKDGDEAIEGQQAGKVPNPDPYTLVNTLQKMAEKRALIGAVLTATRASGIFTQDIEDMDIATLNGEPKAKPAKKARKAKSKKADDPWTHFWSFVEDHDIEKKTAQGFLDQHPDPLVALRHMKVQLGFADEESIDIDDTQEIPF